MTHEYKVGDKVRVVSGNHEGKTGTLIEHRFQDYPWFELDDRKRGVGIRAHELSHFRVPVGYTGKLKDMDLREGDVVKGVLSHLIHTVHDDGIVGTSIQDSISNHTLISRADTPQWSKWQMSKEDGTIQETWDEIETHPIPDMENQVLYRGRNKPKKEPVVKTVKFQNHYDTTVGKLFYGPSNLDTDFICDTTLTLHDGIPVSGTLDFSPKPAS